MKKLLSIVLALVMVFTFMVPAFAEGTTVVYYVNGAIDGEAVAATAGETYKPDRMPTAAAPDEQYFVGWASEDGNIYADGFTLAEGENKLTAVYADYPVETKVNVTGQNYFNNNRAYLPSYIEGNDPAYYPYIVPVTSGAVNYKYIAATDDQPAYMHWYNGQYGGNKSMIFTDENGNAIQGKWGTKYRITVKFRIPVNEGIVKDTENEPAAVGINFMMGFGAQAAKRDTNYSNAYGSGASGANWKFASLVDNGGVEFASCWDDWGATKYGLGTISYNGNNYTSPSAITGDEWETIVYEITTPAENADYLPVFTLNIRMNGWGSYKSLDQQLDIAEITIADTTKALVQYVENGEVVSTVNGLTTGAAYTPDRMPTAATPEGKYFVGWADQNGNIVSTETGMTLAQGKNQLTAVYKSYVKVANVDLTKHVNGSKSNIGYMKNGEYLSWVVGRTGTASSTSYVTDGEESYLKIVPSQYSGGAGYILTDADGDVIQIKNSTTYQVALTYRIPENEATLNFRLQFGAKIYKDGSGTGEAPQFRNTYGSEMDSATKQVNFYSGVEGLTAKWHDNGGYFYRFGADVENPATTDGWVTAIWNVTTPAYDANFLPVFALSVGTSSNSYAQQFHIKSITITDTSWVEPASVAYYVNGEQEGEAITDLKTGTTYAPDRMPTASAPAGKYFAGWKYNGEFVVDAITLAEGENKLEAVYKDYVTGTVNGHLPIADLPTTTEGASKVLLPTVVDGVYQGYTAVNGYGHVTDKTENGEPYLHYTSYADWTNATVQLVHDEDGVAYMAKPDTTYVIEFTYRASFADTHKFNYSDWKNNGGTRASFMMYFNVGFLPEYTRSGYGNSVCCPGGDQYKAVPQQHATWYDHGNGLGFWADVCADGWVTETFKVTTLSAAKYEELGLLPLFNYFIGTNHTENQVDVKSVVIKEVSVHDDFETADINGVEGASYVKLLDEVEDNATYKVVLEGHSANGSWADIGFMTAAADNVNNNQSFIYEDNSPYSAAYGYQWWVTNTVYITTDLAAQGDALYLYVANRANLKYLNVHSIEKVEAVSNGGVSILKDQPADATQAMRFYFDYETTTGSDIVIGGTALNVVSRGFLIADADKIGDAVVTRQTAKAENSGIIDMNTTDLTKCWAVTDTGSGSEELTFSTYITGFKADNGTYNNSNKIYVKGYVVLESGAILYAEESVETVASVANQLGLN